MRSWSAIALFALIAFAAPACASAATLKIATLAPDGTSWMRLMREAAAEVAQRTEGRVELKFYPGGVMGNDRSVLRKVRIGQLQGGALTAGALAEVYPDAQLYSLPMLFRDYAEVEYVREHMDPLIAQGFYESGFVLLGITDGGFGYVMSAEPMPSMEILRTRKVFIPEGDLVGKTVMEAAGISPIGLPLADVYTALQTGLIDTVVATPTAAIALQWHTRLHHAIDQPLIFIVGMLVVDRRSFDRLSAADQAVVREAVGRAFERLSAINRDDDLQARAALERNGMRFAPPSDAKMSEWDELAARTIERLRGQGVYTQDMLDQLKQHLRALRGQPHAGN
jgi:TRAP-type C4-dicarboxylate transport system substrate-binding protein